MLRVFPGNKCRPIELPEYFPNLPLPRVGGHCEVKRPLRRTAMVPAIDGGIRPSRGNGTRSIA
jgi:hypothetical protein